MIMIPVFLANIIMILVSLGLGIAILIEKPFKKIIIEEQDEVKKIITEKQSEDLEKLLGKRVTLFCCRYIYTGELVGVSEDSVLLSDCGIVYETGAFNQKDWQDYQKLPNDWYIARQSIESFGLLK